MHESSYLLMSYFINTYLTTSPLTILDIGSFDPNLNYYRLCSDHFYSGLDITKGPGVNIVSKDLYHYPIQDNTYDVVISGQTIEHVFDLHKWIKEISRVVKIGGLVCIIGPNTWIEHKYPVDCWRIFPDGMKFLLSEIGSLNVLECRSERNDTIGIAKKL